MNQELKYPIPNQLNLFLTIFVMSCSIGIFFLASQASTGTLILLSFVFAGLFLTSYSLLHEAAHDKLHQDKTLNKVLGIICGMLFPLSWTLLRTTHWGHHLRNRTDSEMFDLYYREDSKLFVYIRWYSILLGLNYFYVALSGIAVALIPIPLLKKLVNRDKPTKAFLEDIIRENIWQLRLEVGLIISFHFVIHLLFQLPLSSTLILYIPAVFCWSTVQYIEHAYTPRDVLKGAYNLDCPVPLRWILLNKPWDLNHHNYPDVPWLYLPHIPGTSAGPHYFKQYLKQWSGPRLTTDPSPTPRVRPE